MLGVHGNSMRPSLRAIPIVIATAAVIVLIPATTYSQEQSPASVRVCIAKLKNETRQDLNVLALRDRLTAYLKNGPLAKTSRAEFLVLKEDSDAKVAPELKELNCAFAVYTRIVNARMPDPTPEPLEPMPTTRFPAKAEEPKKLVPISGLQFTVVRVRTGIPVLIDRTFANKPLAKDEDLWPLLLLEQERIDAELPKKLTSPKPS